MLILRMIRPPDLLNKSSTSANKSMKFYKKTIPSTSINVTGTGSHRWVKRFGLIFRKRGSHDPIASFFHFNMGHTPSPRYYVRMPSN